MSNKVLVCVQCAVCTYNGHKTFHLFKQFVFTKFQINLYCCAGKRNEYTDEHFECANAIHTFIEMTMASVVVVVVAAGWLFIVLFLRSTSFSLLRRCFRCFVARSMM